jgi:hypothetical protein
VTLDEERRRSAEQTFAERWFPYVGEAVSSRDLWTWVQLTGLGLLAAGVAVLVAFALTLGTR